MTRLHVDLYSDVDTRPTPAMRQFMAAAEVGDEQKGEDPTVNLLQEMAAELTGKQAALFLPSGTMCNLIAFTVHCRPGDEIIIEKNSHPVHFEGGAPAVHARASIFPIETARGIFTAADVDRAIRRDDPHFPKSRVVSLENTHNMGGGTVWPITAIAEVAAAARRHNLIMHLDGARLMNAVVASGVTTAQICSHFDSVWIDLTKGLGCPVGAVLAGTKDFIYQARRYKQLFGGAMRQAGIIAAAGVYALRHNVERLAEDHANARRLASALSEIRGITVEGAPETNIVMFDIAGTGLTRAEFFKRIESRGLRMSPRLSSTAVRAVTYLGIDAGAIDRAIAIVRAAVA